MLTLHSSLLNIYLPPRFCSSSESPVSPETYVTLPRSTTSSNVSCFEQFLIGQWGILRQPGRPSGTSVSAGAGTRVMRCKEVLPLKAVRGELPSRKVRHALVGVQASDVTIQKAVPMNGAALAGSGLGCRFSDGSCRAKGDITCSRLLRSF